MARAPGWQAAARVQIRKVPAQRTTVGLAGAAHPTRDSLTAENTPPMAETPRAEVAPRSRTLPARSPSVSRALSRNPRKRRRDPCRTRLRAMFKEWMAGAPGFEPGYGGTKNRCLTAWRRPNWRAVYPSRDGAASQKVTRRALPVSGAAAMAAGWSGWMF